MKKLANLKGVKTLSKNEQQSIHGGMDFCCFWCLDGSCQDWVSSPREECPIAPYC